MWLAHHGHYRYPGGSPYRLCDESGQDVFLIMFRDGGYYSGQWGLSTETVLLRNLATQTVEVHILPWCGDIFLLLFFVILDQSAGDVRTGMHISLILW